jgi:uncharacterized BrkB/YihY/UPF0761 family membrane protein
MSDGKKNGLAVSSLIFGVLSFLLLLFGIFTAIPGIIMGHMARSRLHNYPHIYSGGGMAMIGLILNYLVLIVTVIVGSTLFYLVATGRLDWPTLMGQVSQLVEGSCIDQLFMQEE